MTILSKIKHGTEVKLTGLCKENFLLKNKVYDLVFLCNKGNRYSKSSFVCVCARTFGRVLNIMTLLRFLIIRRTIIALAIFYWPAFMCTISSLKRYYMGIINIIYVGKKILPIYPSPIFSSLFRGFLGSADLFESSNKCKLTRGFNYSIINNVNEPYLKSSFFFFLFLIYLL